MKNAKFGSLMGLPPFVLKTQRLILVALFFIACNKDSGPNIADKLVKPTPQAMVLSRSEIEIKVVSYAQWLVNKMVPIVADQNVYAEIVSGNPYSEIVTSKLISLGFEGFDDFSQEFSTVGVDVIAAVNAGTLTEDAIYSILTQNISFFNFNALGISLTAANLPCYDAFLVNVMQAIIMTSVGALSSAGAAIVAGAAGMIYAYLAFKQCIKQYE